MDAADDAVKEAWEENAAAAALRVAADQLYAENLPSCDGASTSLHDGESLLNPFYSTPRKHTAATSRNDARTRAGTSQRIGRTPRSHALTPAAAAHPEAGRAHRTPLDRDLDLGDDAQPHFAKLRAADCTGLQEARSRVCHLRDMWEQNHARHSQRQIEIRDLYAQCGGPESQTPREMRGGDGQVMTSLTSPRGLTSESSDRHRKPQDKLFVITSLAEGHGGENLKQVRPKRPKKLLMSLHCRACDMMSCKGLTPQMCQTTVYPDAAFQVQDTAFNSLLNERTRSLGSGDGQMPTHRSHLAQRMHTNKLALQSEIILERTVFNGGSATLRRARRVRGGGDEKDARKGLTPREHPTTGNARRSLLAHEGGGDLQLLGESDLPSRRPRRLEGQGGALATGVCQTRDRDVDGGRTEGGVSTRRIEDKGNYGQKRGKSEAGATVWADTAVVFSQPETYTALRRESLPVPSSTSEASDMKETVLRASHARRTQSEALVTAAVKQNSSMTPRTSVSEAKVSYRERLEDAQKVAAQKDLHLDAGERPLVYSKAKDFVVPLVEIGFMASAMNVMQRRPMSLEMKTSAEMEAIRMELLKVNPELETSRFPALKSSCPSVEAEETTHHEVKGGRPTGAVTERHRHNERPTGISMTARDHLRQSTPGWHDKEISTDASHKCKNPQGSWVPRATAMRMSAKKHVGSEEQPFRKLIHNKGQIDWSAGVSGMGKGAKIMQASYADWIRVCDTYPVSPRRVPDLAALGNHPKVGMIELGPVMGGDRRYVLFETHCLQSSLTSMFHTIISVGCVFNGLLRGCMTSLI